MNNVVAFQSKKKFYGLDTADELLQAVRRCPMNRGTFHYVDTVFEDDAELSISRDAAKYQGANTEFIMLQYVEGIGTAVYNVCPDSFTLSWVGVFDAFGKDISDQEPSDAAAAKYGLYKDN